MNNVFVVGNSHIAALKMGFPAGEAPFEPGYFGASGKLVRHLTIADGRLFLDFDGGAEHSERLFGLQEVNLASASAFLLAGMSFSTSLAFGLYASYNPWPKRGDSRIFVSVECFEAALRSALVRTPAWRLASALIAATQRPLMIVEQPATNELVLTSEGRDAKIWKRSPHYRALQDGTADKLDEIFRRVTLTSAPAGAAVIFQPEETKVAGGMTRSRYAVPHRPERAARDHMFQRDYGHANAEYGAEVWRAIREAET